MMDRTMKAALAVMLVGTLAVPAAAMAAVLQSWTPARLAYENNR